MSPSPCWTRPRWMTLGGTRVAGRSFMPSSNRACLAILTRFVSGSNHKMLVVVLGRKPRKIPFREAETNLRLRRPGGGCTHTRQPNVRRREKSGCGSPAKSSGDSSRRQCIINVDPMMKCIWPELDIQRGANEKSSNSICNGKMTTFNRTVLI